jgi:hypothetical protein
MTNSLSLLKRYQREHQELITEYEEDYTEAEDQERMSIGQEIMEQIEFKKSFLLAQMLENRKSSDINFEMFPKYDHYLETTLTNPDEIRIKLKLMRRELLINKSLLSSRINKKKH